mgnify:CR=1 FL=1
MGEKQQLIIVINGRGGVGKDTLCEVASTRYRTRNISSITPIKDIARHYGWNGEKDLRSRKFLSDLKRAFTEYNDLPTQYLMQEYCSFRSGEEQILFVHIREPEEIARFVRQIKEECVTMLITREDPLLATRYGNHSDDDVDQYPYDVVFDNTAPLEESSQRFLLLLKQLWEKSAVTPS